MEKAQLSTNEKLDIVLKVLNQAHKDSFLQEIISEDGKSKQYRVPDKPSCHKSITDISISSIFYMEKPIHIDSQEFQLILDYLCENRYCQSHLYEDKMAFKYHKYSIRYEGKVLIENGGFVTKEIDHDIQVNQSKNLSIWVAVGTVGIVLVEILKWLLPAFLKWFSNCCGN